MCICVCVCSCVSLCIRQLAVGPEATTAMLSECSLYAMSHTHIMLCDAYVCQHHMSCSCPISRSNAPPHRSIRTRSRSDNSHSRTNITCIRWLGSILLYAQCDHHIGTGTVACGVCTVDIVDTNIGRVARICHVACVLRCLSACCTPCYAKCSVSVSHMHHIARHGITMR